MMMRISISVSDVAMFLLGPFVMCNHLLNLDIILPRPALAG
jgi:hypothetical protein